MPCPDCGSVNTNILRTKEMGEQTIRRVQCADCCAKYSIVSTFVKWTRKGRDRVSVESPDLLVNRLTERSQKELYDCLKKRMKEEVD